MKPCQYNYRFIVLIILLVGPSLFLISVPNWQRKIKNYGRVQYNAGSQNWMIAQSNNNWIYFANSNGLLEFDGINWNTYPIRNEITRSLLTIGNRIYVGGSSEFGYFTTNKSGVSTYSTLSDRVKNWGGEIWNIMENQNRIYFIAERYIHVYDIKQDNITTITFNQKIDCSTVFGSRLYFATSNGLYFVNSKNNIEYLKSSEALKGQKIVNISPYEDDILVTTAQFGLFLVNEKTISKIHSAADTFIFRNRLFSSDISGSKMVLGSVQNGAFLFDLKDSTIKEELNISNGLSNNTVLSCFFDNKDNLWLGLDKGLSYIDLNSPVRPLFASVSPIGTGYCSMLLEGELYFGTNQGLYKSLPNGFFQLIKGSEGQIWSLNIIDNKLFATGDNGIVVISTNENYKINLQGAWETHPLAKDKDHLIVATYAGLHILQRKDGHWAYSHQLPDFKESCRGFIEDEEPYTFWFVNINSKIQKVAFNSKLDQKLDQKDYIIPRATMKSNVIFRKIDNNISLCTSDGIFRYSRITDTFEPYSQLESILEGSKYYEYLIIDEFRNIWFVADNNLKIHPYRDKSYDSSIQTLGFSSELVNSYENVYMMNNELAIVAVDNGFVKIDLSQNNSSLPTINAFIKKININKNDSIVHLETDTSIVELPYSLNSFKISYGATCYEYSSDILYSYRLRGIDAEWSNPTTDTQKEYTNLKEGEYIFEVRALVKGFPDSISSTSISILIHAPWYRSNLAIIIYTLSIIIIAILLYKKTIGKHKKLIEEKKEELTITTKKYESESKLKDMEIYKLQNENLQNELHYKTQELNGYILNVVRKNEILEDIKKEALGISKTLDENKNISFIKQGILRLITNINGNIEHDNDFKVFESNFDLIHHDFFKLLDQKFPGLTRNDKILCAYLKMNLSSKEIVPLLNISVRGVEVNRYRLRKKMNLDRDINLSEYLNNLK